MRSPVIHQKSSPSPAAGDPSGLSSGSCHGRCITRPGGLREIELRFSEPPDQDHAMDSGSRDPETFLPASIICRAQALGSQVAHAAQFAGDLHLASHTVQSLVLPAHVFPVPSYCVYCRSWLTSCGFARSGCATTNTNSQLPMRNHSCHCAYLTVALGPWLASELPLYRTTVPQYQASHFTMSPGVAVDHALS
jgi:hypothetical protein